MNEFQERSARRENVVGTRYEEDGSTVLVADLGPDVEGSVDVVDGTAMVVVGDDQYEFDVPDGRATARLNNGVVTVEVTRE
ncbi:hypothetical protein [Halosegnis marinus]|uniref:Uncharacterized protein n=1 Tax=Halosegnis marinus TaxID=3034023 RepID=A0ABD5ZKK1_9EURY|nr:hypothetical protein [Halosegnis sp. DT85]